MKAIRENILYASGSFTAYLFEGESFNHPYHFHVENEIVLILESNGKLILGDHLSEYKEGDIFVLGENMPHSFVCVADSPGAKSLVIQFNNNCFGEQFFQLPEFRTINQMLEKSRYGVKIVDEKNQLRKVIEETCNSEGVKSVISLLNLLHEISKLKKVELISPNNSYVDSNLETHKLNAAIEWLDTNYAQSVHLSEIAKITNLSENGFCRAFKKATGKTFLHYLSDKRIHEAARLLIETEHSITQIAFEVGFSNISSFNRYFKKVKGVSPTEFRKNLISYVGGE
ncbi:AraC family transcriptional regulator [Vibrio vulnificus]|uniref:AraC family transcriptional regulator n=1 Tax=Vibrio vulnificus TaxID=672 RepID=UPI0010289911|nr:AraC family transcriptional regulator [Vibrio vulnificus]RZP71765.1 AraC family transcriptional regulator [Vibrio vulnificus]RZP71880.1 AraC family transcriptional regulator [Vibrio vulnificus]